MPYSHTYFDREIGDYVDVHDDDEHDVDYRNAGPNFLPHRRGRGFRRLISRRGERPGNIAIRPRPDNPPRLPGRRPVVVREPEVAEPLVPSAPDLDGHIVVNKTALANLVPAAGQVWASFLIPPDAPKATGDDIVDRDNAAMHRQALAAHQQNQTRILALTDLAARAVKLFW